MTRHRLDLLSLVFGLLFSAVGLAALADAIDFDLLAMDWLWPTVLIGSGVAVLLTLAARERQEPGGRAAPPDDPDRDRDRTASDELDAWGVRDDG